MSLAFISHPDCLLHEMGHHIPEIPQRLMVINDEMINSGLDSRLKKYIAPKATVEQLSKAHDKDYVEYVMLSSPKTGTIPLDPDTWMNPFTLSAALHAAGAVILAVDLVLSGEVESAYCNIRPPGHHAEKSSAMGFCFFNNVAVAAMHALTTHHLKKVAIIDFDAHHGNGIEDIFKNEPRVLYCSSFEHPFYPYSGANTHSAHIINVPLSAGADSKRFREQAQQSWFKAVLEFEPELIFISAGFDASEDDNMSNLLFTIDDYAWITREIKQIARQVCQGRVVSVLEGGYCLETLGKCVAAHLRELI